MKFEKFVLLIILLGIGLSTYLTYLHFEVVDSSSFCDINNYLSCSTVNKSVYSIFLGVPVSIIGFVGLLLLGYLLLKKPKYHEALFFILSATALVFMLYLAIVEVGVIKALCILCLIVLLIVLIIFIYSLFNHRKHFLNFFKKIIFE